MSRTINIENVGKYLEAYKKRLDKGTRALIKALGEEGLKVTSVAYASAPYAGTKDELNVKVYCRGKDGEYTAEVSAQSRALLFIEFGTGILNDGNEAERSEIISGSVSPLGTYGSGRGASPKGWMYSASKGVGTPAPSGTKVTKGGNLIHTFGNDATPVMYEGRKYIQMESTIARLVNEIFGGG